jgi:hypothetical protein
MRRERTDMSLSPTPVTLRGQNPKAVLLLLCARIGYTPHGSFQH